MDEDSLQESEIPVLYPQSGKAHTHHTLLACWLLQAVLPYIQPLCSILFLIPPDASHASFLEQNNHVHIILS